MVVLVVVCGAVAGLGVGCALGAATVYRAWHAAIQAHGVVGATPLEPARRTPARADVRPPQPVHPRQLEAMVTDLRQDATAAGRPISDGEAREMALAMLSQLNRG